MFPCYFARQRAVGSSGLQRLPPLSGLFALRQLEDVSDCHTKWVWRPCTILFSVSHSSLLGFPLPAAQKNVGKPGTNHSSTSRCWWLREQVAKPSTDIGTCRVGLEMGPAEMEHEKEGKDQESPEQGLGFPAQTWLAKKKKKSLQAETLILVMLLFIAALVIYVGFKILSLWPGRINPFHLLWKRSRFQSQQRCAITAGSLGLLEKQPQHQSSPGILPWTI